MHKIIKVTEQQEDIIIPMNEMKPLQVGVVVEAGVFKGHSVYRTASSLEFEVMDLTVRNWWDRGSTLKVRLLRKGESITIKLFNEE